MSSKKRPRPLFEVPVDIDSAQESGWVYRSGGSAESEPHARSAASESCGAFVDAGASTLALGLAAVAQTFMLGVTVSAMPFTLGYRAMRSLAGSR